MYGYRIENGRPAIDAQQAARLRDFFHKYLSGMSLRGAAKAAKIGKSVGHVSAKKMLKNRRYLGDGDYPAIIDEDVFAQVQKELSRRAATHARTPKMRPERKQFSGFRMRKPAQNYDDPAIQAEYLYSLIECEV